jgi:pimeloyl-ACP methyl ester carboxylesterase
VDRGIATAVLDAPSDQPKGMTDDFRLGPRHAADVAAVVTDLKTRFPGIRVFLVGTSRGSVSAAPVAVRLGDTVAGTVLTSSMFRATNPQSSEPGPGLSRFDFSSIKVPALIVHHRDDGCGVTPYVDAYHLGKKVPLITVKGGRRPESEPCQPMSAHGFFGKEVETIDAIAGWMLGQPYRKEIE